MDTLKRLIASATLAGLLATAGCAGTLYAEDEGYYADAPPPAAVVEARGVAPYPDAYWIDGYWGWGGGRYNWHRGYWDHVRAGYVYQPHRWYRAGNRWRMEAGHWRRNR